MPAKLVIDDDWQPERKPSGRKRKEDELNQLLESAMVKDGHQRVLTFDTVEEAKQARYRIAGRKEAAEWDTTREQNVLAVRWNGDDG